MCMGLLLTKTFKTVAKTCIALTFLLEHQRACNSLLIFPTANCLPMSFLSFQHLRYLRYDIYRHQAPINLNQFLKTSTIHNLIIKITISSIVIGLKNSYFPLIHLLRCYRRVP